MKHFKLNFYRFEGENINIGNLELGARLNIDGLDADGKKAESVYDKVTEKAVKAAEAQDTLTKSVTNTRKSFETIKEDSVRAFNRNLDVLRDMANISTTSGKTKGKITSLLGKAKGAGLDNLKIKDAKSLTTAQANRVLTLNKQASNLVGSAITELPRASAREKFSVQKGGSPLTGNLSFGKTGDIDKGTSAIDKLRSAMNALDKAEEAAHNKFNSFVNSLKSTAITWRIIGGFLSKIVNIFASLYENAASYEEALNLYRVAMDEHAEDADNWAKRISEPLFLDPKDVMQYAGAFYNLTNGLGASSEAAYLMATNLTQLSYDMSSYLNIDVEAAQAKIQSAITGQARAVASAGVAMQQASLQELAYTLQLKDNTVALDDNALEVVRHSIGLKKSVKDMTQAEKTYLRYIQIMRSTTHMQNDLARTIVTPANAMRVVRTQFSLFARELGTAVIPIVMKVIPYIMVLTQALQKLGRWLGKKLGYQVADIDYSSLQKGTKAYTSLGDAANEAAGKTSKAADTINRSLAPFDELNVVETESSGGSGGVGAGAGGAGGSVLGDLEEYLEGYDMLKGLTDKFEKEMETAKENIKKMIPSVAALAGAFTAIKFTKTFMEDYDTVTKFLKSDAGKKTLKIIESPEVQNVATVAGLVVAVYENFKSVNDETDRMKEAWETGDWKEYFKIDSLDELIDKVRTVTFILQGGLPAALVVAGKKFGWFDGIIKGVKDTFNIFKDFVIDVVSKIGDSIKEHFGDIKNNIINEAIVDVFHLKNDFDDFIQVVEKWGKKLSFVKDNIKDGFINFMHSTFATTIELIKGKIEGFISTIEGILGTIKYVVKALKDIGNGDWKAVWDDLKNFAINAFKGIASPIAKPLSAVLKAIESAINGAINAVRKFIDQINKIHVDIPGGKSIGFDIPKPSTISIDTSMLDRLKTGIDFVPNDLYGPVFLDYGERVLTQEENRQYMKANDAYLSNLSNSAAIGNTKQLASEIANAIVDSMKLAEASRQPDITQVYIGNEKVYEGQGTYQSRQADRYGTSYIKI